MKVLGMRWRIALALVVVVVAACGALTVTTTQWAAHQFEARLVQDALRVANLNGEVLGSAVEAQPAVRTADAFFDVVNEDMTRNIAGTPTQVIVVPVEPPSGVVQRARAHEYVAGSGPSFFLDDVPECLAPGSGRLSAGHPQPGKVDAWVETCGDYVMGYALVGPSNDDAWLVVNALYRGDFDDPVPGLQQTLLTYSGMIVAASVLLAIGLAAMVARPLTRTRSMAEAVAAGSLDVRIPVHGRDEVARLGAAVNTMADRLTAQIADLEHANQAQRQFVSDVAHELRTPTAALLALSETLQDPTSRDEAASLVAPQLRRLAGLTEDLLEISRMDAGRAEVVRDEIDLVDLLAEVVAHCGAPDLVTVSGPAELTVSVDAARLRVVVRNLLANALQHGAAPVTITVSSAADEISVAVHDDGPGVPAALADRVFDRFVRGDDSRHGASSGLGLAIARENARLLGATLELGPDRRTFTLRLRADPR